MILVPLPPQAYFSHRGEGETRVSGDEAPLRPFSSSFARKVSSREWLLDPVVRDWICAKLMLNYNTFFSSEAFSRMISSILFSAPNYWIVDKKNYIELALNNPALDMR